MVSPISRPGAMTARASRLANRPTVAGSHAGFDRYRHEPSDGISQTSIFKEAFMISTSLSDSIPASDIPSIRRLTTEDLGWALRSGWQDFRAKRGDLLFVALLYPLLSLTIAIVALQSALLPLYFPLVAGLSVMGPVVAAGFYEIARRRETGDDSGWRHFLAPLSDDRREGLLSIAIVLIGLFLVWLLVAWVLYQATVGQLHPVGAAAFADAVLTTPEGWTMIVLGNLAGGAIATITLVLTVVSVPMVVDKPVRASLALHTSVEAVTKNRGAMIRWGVIVALMLIAGSIPLFLGLAVVLPVLGYATWHLYTRVVDR